MGLRTWDSRLMAYAVVTRSLPTINHMTVDAPPTQPMTYRTLRQLPTNSSNCGVAIKARPQTVVVLPNITAWVKGIWPAEDHCWINRALGAWVAIMEMPKAMRPTMSRAKVGDQPCSTMDAVMPRKHRMTTRRGLYLDSHSFNGMLRTRLPRTTEDPSHPCWDGDKPSSSEMSGSRRPKMKMVVSAVAAPVVKAPRLTHL